MPLSLANRFQAALLGSCLGPISLMPPPEQSGTGLEPNCAPTSRTAAPSAETALAAAIAHLEAGAQRAGVPLAASPDRSPTGDDEPSPLGQPLQALLLQLPGQLLALGTCSPVATEATILARRLRGEAIAPVIEPSPQPTFLGQYLLDVAAPPAPSGHDKAVLRSSPIDSPQASLAVARLALQLGHSHWALLGGQLRAIAQAQHLAPATTEAAASWLGIWFGAAHGIAALPWRPQVNWGSGRSRLLGLGDRLYRHWSGQTDPQKVGVSWGSGGPTLAVLPPSA